MKKTNRTLPLLGAFAVLLSFVTNAQTQEVTIGSQTWTNTNLNVSTFRNGDSIPEAK
jgi:hypothetical protein